MRSLCLVLVLMVAFAGRSTAERLHADASITRSASSARTSVYVDHAGSDAAGRAFVKGIRDSIRSSQQFRLAEGEDDAMLVLVVVSVSPAPPNRVASAISLAYVVNNEWRTLLGSAARFVGRERAEAMGRDVLPELSAILAAHTPTQIQ